MSLQLTVFFIEKKGIGKTLRHYQKLYVTIFQSQTFHRRLFWYVGRTPPPWKCTVKL